MSNVAKMPFRHYIAAKRIEYILRFILKLPSENSDYNCSAVRSTTIDWARFKLKASKSKELVFKTGKAIEWFVDDVEEGGSSGEVFGLNVNFAINA